MGLFKAAFDAISGAFADQWKDFFTVPDGLPPTAALFGAARRGVNAGRGDNTGASTDVISNGSKIVVPEGYGLILMQDGAVTGFAAEPGGYEWNSDAQDSQSLFAGDGFVSPLIKTSWERFKFGGRPQSQQRAYFVSLKELPNNKFGTISEIYWDDAYLGAQAGASVRGSYSLRIADPILFVKNLVPATYLAPGTVFDFTDLANDVATQLFNEVVGSLAAAFARYINDPAKNNRMSTVQQDALGFARSLSEVVDAEFGWSSVRGLEIVKTAIVAIEYDAQTRELLTSVQRADALGGARGNSNLQASVARGLESAGEAGGAAAIIGMGMASSAAGGLSGLQQPVAAPVPPQEDGVAQLTRFKQMLDAGLITQDDYDAAKRRALGL